VRAFGKRTSTPGSAPGLLVARSDRGGSALIRLMHYSKDELEELTADSIDEALEYLSRPGITWIDIPALTRSPRWSGWAIAWESTPSPWKTS